MKPLLFYRIKEKITHTGASWDKLAPTQENAIEFAHEKINSEPIKKLDNQHYSLEYCLAHSGETLNEHFRTDRIYKKDLSIANMVATHTCKTDLVLYRGICEYVYEQMIENSKKINNKYIDFYEKGYMQCSLLQGHELNYKTKLRIYVPAGTHVIYLGNVNDEQCYYEVDIQHGAKLKIISIDHKYINCKLIETA